MNVIRIHSFGGPEVLSLDELSLPQPGPGQARVRVQAAGVNFMDVYQRIGLYKLTLPLGLGAEGAGVVEAVGPDVSEVKPGDRVVWTGLQGSYADYLLAPAARLVALPEAVSFETGAAVLLQGLTVQYLVRSTFPIQPGHRVLIHAAAGGVGLLFVQVARKLGATVYGTVGSREKARLVQEMGADAAIVYTETDFVAEVKRLTGGQGLHAVYDSVGKDTLEKSLQCLAPRGMLISFGQASGAAAPVDVLTLSTLGSLYLTRPVLAHHVATRAELLARSQDLFSWLAEGLQVRIDSTFPLAQAADAHRRIESRASIGKILIKP